MAVCLHCLHAARIEARERRQRIVIRLSLWTLGIAVLGAVGAAATGAVIKGPGPSRPVSRTARNRVAPPRPKSDTVMMVASAPAIPQGEPDSARPPARDTVAATPSSRLAAVPSTPVDSTGVVAPPIGAIRLVIAPGRTEMPDSLYADRIGDTVVVHFDTSPARTRRADKFERIVRQTLATVYGPVADTLLGTVADGRLAQPNELLTVLPQRGIHLATPTGRRIVLWPETRPGRDGPLVVSYRTVVER